MNYKEQIEKVAKDTDEIKASKKAEKKEIKAVKNQHRKGEMGAIGAGAIGSAVAGALGNGAIGIPSLTGEITPGHMHGEQLTSRLGELADLAGIGGKYDLRASGMANETKFVGPHFNPFKKYIDGGHSIPNQHVDSILAHEVGHASRGRIGKTLDMGLPMAASAAGLGMAFKPVRDKVRSLDGDKSDGVFNKSMNFVEDHPFMTATGLFAGSILPREMAASAKAIKLLAKESGNPNKLKALANATATHGPVLGKALGNYAAASASKSFGQGMLINNSVKRNKIKDIKNSYEADREKQATDYVLEIEKTAKTRVMKWIEEAGDNADEMARRIRVAGGRSPAGEIGGMSLAQFYADSKIQNRGTGNTHERLANSGINMGTGIPYPLVLQRQHGEVAAMDHLDAMDAKKIIGLDKVDHYKGVAKAQQQRWGHIQKSPAPAAINQATRESAEQAAQAMKLAKDKKMKTLAVGGAIAVPTAIGAGMLANKYLANRGNKE